MAATLDRLEIVVAGRRQPAMPTAPAPELRSSPWPGFVVERHKVPALELPDHFNPYYLVTVGFCAEPTQHYWFENGREQCSVFRSGGVGIDSPRELRRFRTESPGELTAVEIETNTMRNLVGEFLHGRDAELFRRSGHDDLQIRQLVLALERELASDCPTGPLRGESLCTQLAITLIQKHSIERVRLDEYRGGLSKARLRRVTEYIDAFLDQALNGDELAKVAGLSRYHFGKMFKQSTSMSLHQYVLQRRIQRATSLLLSSGRCLAEIALATGFSNQSHFTTVFTSRLGVTPAAYRNVVGGRDSSRTEL